MAAKQLVSEIIADATAAKAGTEKAGARMKAAERAADSFSARLLNSSTPA
jgi:hypothetical protein